jgi:stalled ribosome rescue protein Dom34
MIKILISIGEHKDAERYVRISYECLTRPVDSESMMVADTAESLESVVHEFVRSGEVGDIVEAKKLARDSRL